MKNKEIFNLIKEMTLDEKVALIHGAGLFKNGEVKRLNIPSLKMADGPRGVRQDFLNDQWIPLNQNDDFVSYLPSGTAIASSFNLNLAYQYGLVLGREARGRGKDIILAPSVNIKRSPLNGRNFEYLSEDPYLTKKMAVEMVKGIQENDVAACIKHFAANNQETARLSVDTIVSEKALHEIYFPAFKSAVQEANTYSVMSAYNKVNGDFASQSYYLLNEVLRNTWGFKGAVISDWSAVNNTIEAAKTGIDIEMSVTNDFDNYFMANPLKKLVKDGLVDIKYIDEKVFNILKIMANLKMIGSNQSKRSSGTYNTKEHQQITYEIAKEGIVLLKNENILPISKNIEKVLVIGDNATRLHASAGGSAEIKALYEISPLQALKEKLGSNVKIDYVKGYLAHDVDIQDSSWQESSLLSRRLTGFNYSKEIISKQNELREEAINKAKDYDYIILFAGLNHAHDLEGYDKFDITLPYNQELLIEELLNLNKKIVVHLLSGSAVDVSKWHHKANALLWSSYNGMEGSRALIDIIFGDVNPSGKLTETFAEKLNDYPSHSIGEFGLEDTVHYLEDLNVGYKHFVKNNIQPIFPFGYGLSYSQFELTDFLVNKDDQKFNISLNIQNISNVNGSEVIQIYIKGEETNNLPILKAFKKVLVEQKTNKKVNVKLPISEFSFFNERIKDLKIVKGNYQILIGTNVNNILFETNVKI